VLRTRTTSCLQAVRSALDSLPVTASGDGIQCIKDYGRFLVNAGAARDVLYRFSILHCFVCLCIYLLFSRLWIKLAVKNGCVCPIYMV